jgi:hypothetical protein
MATKFSEVKTVKKDYGRVEDGTYPARIVQLVMLGEQLQTDWKTGEALTTKNGDLDYRPEIWVTFEFPTERVKYEDDEGVEVDRPRWTSIRYTFSFGEKANFKKLINAVAPNAEVLDDLIGAAGIVTVGSTSGGKAKITGVTSPMKGMTIPELENEPIVYDLDEPDEEVFDSLPDFLQENIRNRRREEDSVEDVEENEDPFAE